MLEPPPPPTGPAGYTPAYAALRPLLASGDIVLYGGATPQCLRLKQWLASCWSHVGMILRPSPEDDPLLWEATGTTGMADLLSGSQEGGVHLVRLEEWIALYGGDIAVRRLSADRGPEREQAFRAFFEKVHGRPYERTHTKGIRAGFHGLLRNRREDLRSIFCSQLVAAAYQRVGLLPRHPPSSTYTPRDFAAERGLKLLGDAALGEEVMIHL